MLCVFARGKGHRRPASLFEPVRAHNRGHFPHLVMAASHAASVRFELARKAVQQ
jgi:hypothetical protein